MNHWRSNGERGGNIQFGSADGKQSGPILRSRPSSRRFADYDTTVIVSGGGMALIDGHVAIAPRLALLAEPT